LNRKKKEKPAVTERSVDMGNDKKEECKDKHTKIETLPLDEFEKLLRSTRYKKADCKIQKVNDAYALNMGGKSYVDLKSKSHIWYPGDTFFKDCLGTKEDVVAAFNYRYPEIIDLDIQEEY